jgi:hypothetical protein
VAQRSSGAVPKWLVAVVIVVVVFAIGAISRLAGGRTDPPRQAATETKPPVSFASQDVSEDSVRAALGNDIDLVKVEVQDNLGTDAPGDKIVHVSYKPGGASALGEKPMLMDLVKQSAGAFKALFANPKVGAADVTAMIMITSSGGADSQTAGARINWDRKKADTVDWAKYESDVVGGYYWDAFTGASDSYVHPGVLAGLSAEDRAKLKK